MKPYFANASFTLYHGDAREVVASFSPNSIDSVVCDPPYELGFMGKKWDSSGIANDVNLWKTVFASLKPGGHCLAFSGTRTYHRMVCAIEDAGFEIRDQIGWLYGSGFPKSLNVSKAIESGGGRPEDIRKMQMGEEYQPSGRGRVNYDHGAGSAMNGAGVKFAPKSDAAQKWEGWGTALKPAWEPIVVARKPLIGTVAANVSEHGTGALNVSGCRIPAECVTGWAGAGAGGNTWNDTNNGLGKDGAARPVDGRWPANVIHDGSDEVVAAFPDASGAQGAVIGKEPSAASDGSRCFNAFARTANSVPRIESATSAARFFYCAKADRTDRDEGLVDFDFQKSLQWDPTSQRGKEHAENGWDQRKNFHPTVKPTALMRYLCRLITPPGGTVLDWCNGSGSTGKGAIIENFRYIGVDLTGEYLPISKARILYALEHRAKWDELHAFAEKPAPDVEGQTLFALA